MSRVTDLPPPACASEGFCIGRVHGRARVLALLDELLDELYGENDDREERFAYCHGPADIVREIRSLIDPESSYAPRPEQDG